MWQDLPIFTSGTIKISVFFIGFLRGCAKYFNLLPLTQFLCLCKCSHIRGLHKVVLKLNFSDLHCTDTGWTSQYSVVLIPRTRWSGSISNLNPQPPALEANILPLSHIAWLILYNILKWIFIEYLPYLYMHVYYISEPNTIITVMEHCIMSKLRVDEKQKHDQVNNLYKTFCIFKMQWGIQHVQWDWKMQFTVGQSWVFWSLTAS